MIKHDHYVPHPQGCDELQLVPPGDIKAGAFTFKGALEVSGCGGQESVWR